MKKKVFRGISFLLMAAMVCQGGITADAKTKAKLINVGKTKRSRLLKRIKRLSIHSNLPTRRL